MSVDEFETFTIDDVQNAINELSERLNLKIDKEILIDYQNGLHPTLLSYEKIETPDIQLPVIMKYLLGAQTYCDHNRHIVHYYDISRATRHCIFSQMLNKAIKICDQHTVKGIEKRISRLTTEKSYDAFDAIMFEIITASKYASLDSVIKVEFIDETQEKSPDFSVEFEGLPIQHFVECKKFDRNVPVFIEIRDRVRDITDSTLKTFFIEKVSAVIDLEFYCDPKDVDSSTLKKQCLNSLRRNAYIRGSQIATKVKVLPKQILEDYTLFPSPKYFWQRYNYRPQSEWAGIVNSINAQPAYLIDPTNLRQMGATTWLNDVDWECAIRWRICDENLKWKIRKLNYNRIFQGLTQLQTRGVFTTLHIWFEREGNDMIREAELKDFFSRLSQNQRDIVSWIVFNETILETSPMGVPDIIEHSHFLCSSIAPSEEPLVTTVFVDGYFDEIYPFGIGGEMPDIDDLYRKKGWI